MDNVMKRWLCVVLAAVLAVAILGCGLLSCAPSEDPEETTTAPAETTAEPTAEETTGQPTQEPTVETTGEPENTEHTHDYTKEAVEPDCINAGKTTYTCSCGDSYTEEAPALGHSYSAKVVPPTESVQGYTEHTCSRCGLSYRDSYTWNTTGDTSFFDDAAFIGDSVTLKLRNYSMTTGALGNATFLCVGSYSVNNAVTNQLYLSYQGQDMTPQDALAACGAKKVFILLGMNDIALFGENSISVAMDNWATMLANIRAKNPDIQIYIQSGTPIYTAGQKGGLNNARMDSYNESLKVFAQENGCHYIDIATPMKDSGNGLAAQYCSDEYVHFTDAACALWVELLKAFVAA